MAYLVGKPEAKVLHERGHSGSQADLGQVLAHAISRSLCKGEVALGSHAVTCQSVNQSVN